MEKKLKALPHQLGLRRYSAVELLVTLALLFVFLPFADDMKGGDLVTSILLSLVLLSAVFAVGRRGPSLIFPASLAIVAIAGRGLNDFRPDLLSPAAFLVPGLILVTYVVAHLLGFVLRAPQVDTGVLCASVSAYLLLGLTWTMAYWLVALFTPDAFAFNTTTGAQESMQGFNAFYFSLVTLSTVGYGDITPVAKVARLVSVYSSRQDRDS